MTTPPFGPRLIGETEKTLNALLRHHLDRHDLSEPQWVTLQLAHTVDDTDAAGLAAVVSDRAHFADADEIVAALTARGLLTDGQPTERARRLVGALRGQIAESTAAIWRDLPEDDVAATTRVLDQVVARGREALASLAD